MTPAGSGTGSGATGTSRVAWAAFWIGLVLRVLQLWLSTHPDPDRVFMAFGIGPLTFAASVVFGTAASAVGIVMAGRLPGNRFGWIWVAVGATQAILASLLLLGADHADSWLGIVAGAIASVGVAQAPFAATALALLTFPTGNLISRRWRALVVGLLVAIGVRGLEIAFGTASIFLLPTVPNPFQARGILGSILEASDRAGVGVVFVLLTVSASVVSVVVRYRQADGIGKRQIRWFMFGAMAYVATLLPAAYIFLVVGRLEAGTSAIFALNFLGFSLLPITTLIAITRYRLYEIDRIVNRTLLYGLLTAILAGVFTAGIGLAQRLFVIVSGETSDAAIVLTTLVVATLYAPLRKRLEAVIDRRFKFDQPMFGAYRHEIAQVLSVVDPVLAAERLIREAVAELAATGGAVLARGGSPTATSGGWPVPVVERIVIRGGPAALATIELGARADGAPYRPEDLVELGRVAEMLARAGRGLAAD